LIRRSLDIGPIIVAHLAHSRASTPAASIHAMDADTLRAAGVQFFALMLDGRAIGCGALKPLTDGSVEVKSVHVLVAHRGQGHARRIMVHLIGVAQAGGYSAMVLETGSALLPGFDAARALYERLGFDYCGPISGYAANPNAAFMRRVLP
jgi:putative acetyltransferase